MVQHGSRWCNMLQDGARWRQHIATWCNMVQHGATLCNMLQHGARWCKMVKHGARRCNMVQNGATSILDGATSGDGLGAVLISRSQPKILRKIQKKLRRYISGISRFLHVCKEEILLSQGSQCEDRGSFERAGNFMHVCLQCRCCN